MCVSDPCDKLPYHNVVFCTCKIITTPNETPDLGILCLCWLKNSMFVKLYKVTEKSVFITIKYCLERILRFNSVFLLQRSGKAISSYSISKHSIREKIENRNTLEMAVWDWINRHSVRITILAKLTWPEKRGIMRNSYVGAWVDIPLLRRLTHCSYELGL